MDDKSINARIREEEDRFGAGGGIRFDRWRKKVSFSMVWSNIRPERCRVVVHVRNGYCFLVAESWKDTREVSPRVPSRRRPSFCLSRGNGLWRAVTAAEGGGDKSEEDAMSSFLKRTGNKSLERKRPAIHFLISIPLPQPFDLYVHLDYNWF